MQTRLRPVAASLAANLVVAALASLFSVIAPAAQRSGASSPRQPIPATTEERPDLAQHFAAAGTQGTIVVRDTERRRTVVVNPGRAARGYSPSSTFKIPNALIALQEGVAASADHIFRGPYPRFLVDGKPLLPAACDGALTLRAAFRNSCIPVFQEIARAIGAERYQRYLRDWSYGNMRMSGAPLERFWLEGDLQISALQQVDFLTRLARGELAGTRDAVERLRDVMATERTGQYLILAKTGYVFTAEPRVGWYVGWVERAGGPVIFALNLDMTQPAHAAARAAITRAILTELQVL